MADHDSINPDTVRAIWTAVLSQAVVDYRYRGSAKGSAVQRIDAANWVNSTYEGVGSFSYVCDVLNIDPDAVRDRLKRSDG